MLLTVYYSCDVGNVRKNNEDGILIMDEFIRDSHGKIELNINDFPVIFAVADGVGGEEAGEIASEIVLKGLSKNIPQNYDEIVTRLRELKNRMQEYAKIKETLKNMSTTVAGLVFTAEDNCLVFNVGDSRVYQLKSYLRRISKDHSLVEMLIDAGELSPENVRTHPNRNIITSSISASDDDFQVYSKEFKVFPGNSFLICSDGLWEEVEEDEMESIILSESENCAEELVERAKINGGRDNISAIVIKVKEQ